MNEHLINTSQCNGVLATTAPADQASIWQSLTASQRSTIKAEYAAAGISLIVSAFGASENPTTDGHDATETANALASWVKAYDLDGVDVDYEDFAAFNSSAAAETWLITFTSALRAQLPAGQFIISHARESTPSIGLLNADRKLPF